MTQQEIMDKLADWIAVNIPVNAGVGVIVVTTDSTGENFGVFSNLANADEMLECMLDTTVRTRVATYDGVSQQ